MKIHVYGCGDKLASQIEDATRFYLSELIPPHLIDGVKFIKIIVGPRTRISGCVAPIKFGDPTRFRMVLASNYAKKNILLTLAHECVHLKQFFLGELQDLHPPMTPNDKTITKWRYRRHYIKKWKYEDQPWEHEADELEPKLYAKYVRLRG